MEKYVEKYQEKLIERFFKYLAIPSQSDAANDAVPSSAGQWKMAECLKEELEALGLEDVSVSENAVCYGHLKSNITSDGSAEPSDEAEETCFLRPIVGWCCHMDTVDAKLSDEIHPLIIKNYQGGDICQSESGGNDNSKYISVSEHPELLKYIGQDIIVSDGTSVLGADDKSALANVVTALEILRDNPEIKHGDIYVAFVPDEEIGLRGSRKIERDKFPVDFAYTIDCCEIGELVYETFNAGHAMLKIKGRSAHPMSAKNALVNASTVAVDFINMLDKAEAPEHTEGREGFIWVDEIHSDGVNATVEMNIRDHDRVKYEKKKDVLREALKLTRMKHPDAELELEISDVYANISDALNDDNKVCIDYLKEAFKLAGVEPNITAMRGGTDGSFLSTIGIPTPNYFTGAHNFHSSCEFLPVESFKKSLQVTLNIIKLVSLKIV